MAQKKSKVPAKKKATIKKRLSKNKKVDGKKAVAKKSPVKSKLKASSKNKLTPEAEMERRQNFLEVIKTPKIIEDFSVVNAFCFSPESVLICIQVTTAEDNDFTEYGSSAILEVNLKNSSYREVFSGGEAISYQAKSASQHYMLQSGGYLVAQGKEEGFFPSFKDPGDATPHTIFSIGNSSVLACGYYGYVGSFQDAIWKQIPTDFQGSLNTVTALEDGIIYASGDSHILKGDKNGLKTIVDHFGLGRITTIQPLADGSILVGCAEGKAGHIHPTGEVKEITVSSAEDFLAINLYQGKEYWGDDSNGVFIRNSSNSLELVFETTYAKNINVSGNLMTVNAYDAVFIFDGKDWIKISLKLNSPKLFEINRKPSVSGFI